MSGYLDSRSRERLEHLTRQQEEQTRRVERRLTLVTWLLGVPSLVFIYLAAIPGTLELKRSFPEDWGLFFTPGAIVTLLLGAVALAVGIGLYYRVGRPAGHHEASLEPRHLSKRLGRIRPTGAPGEER
jgi:hypothetical protein